MSTVFIGGSRHIAELPPGARSRVSNVIAGGHRVVVGDADGVDLAVQRLLHAAGVRDVTVFCSSVRCRNNAGGWEAEPVAAAPGVRGYQLHAAKDRAMAVAADFGLMIWDGKSCGTALNVLRLIRASKICVVIDVSSGRTLNFKAAADWDCFLAGCGDKLRSDLRSRATPDEWTASRRPGQAELLPDDGTQLSLPGTGLR